MEQDCRHIVTDAPARPPAHAARPQPGRRWPFVLAALVGLSAFGAALVLPSPGETPSAPTSARNITVTPVMPLPPSELAALTAQPWDAGPLIDPQRRASCLRGLGYPSATVLGARTMPVNGRPAVVLVLATETAGELRAVVVRPDCDAGRPGRIAEDFLPRP